MSVRKSRRTATTIEYDVSEWDDDVPRPHRKRSNSFDLLDQLRSKKVHSLSHTNFARFPEHYNEHTLTVENEAPNTTYARSYKYGREPRKHECHEWRPRGAPGTNTRGVQCSLKPEQRTTVVQCAPPTREMNVQTHKWRPDTISVKSKTRDQSQQCSGQEPSHFDYNELLQLVKGLMGTNNVSDDTLRQITAALAELLNMLKVVRRTTDTVEQKEDEMLKAIRNIRFGLPEDALDHVDKLLAEILGLMKHLTSADDHAKLVALINERVAELSKATASLKEDYASIMRAIRGMGIQTGFDEDYYKKIIVYLQEILGFLRVEEVQEVTITRRQLYEGRCRCAEINESSKALYKATEALMPSLCQRCINDAKGRTFVHSLQLPSSPSADLVNLFGKAIECIETDDDFNLRLLLRECEDLTSGQWEHNVRPVAYEALFHMALLWKSAACSLLLVGCIDVQMMLRGMHSKDHYYRLPDYIKAAIDGKNLPVLRKLFEAMSDNEKMTVINSPDQKKQYALFDAAREGDVEIFEFLVLSGAALNVRERDRTILHEIVWVSHEKQESPKHNEWNKVLVAMLGAIHDNAGFWWEKHMLHAAWTGFTQASRSNALNYLFSVEDNQGLNALQLAARYGSPEIIRKMVCNPPYEFIPDPIEFGHDGGMKGYIVDQIESRLASKNHSVLERMLLREPLDGARVLSLEPFRSMINDKWHRYQIFYGIWFICYICYMFVYTACAIDRPIGKTSVADMYVTQTDYGRMVGEIFVLVMLPLFFYGEIRDGIRMGFVIPRPWLRTGMFRILTFSFVITTVAVVILRFTFNPDEDIALGIALILGWVITLEFLGAWKSIGMFAIVMHRVVTLDLALKFFLVWLFFLVGTSTATFVAYQRSSAQVIPDFTNETYWQTPLSIIKVSFALLDGDYATQASNAGFGVALFIVVVLVFNFLLLSLAIGMMADTYARVRSSISESWIWVKAHYALLMDRRLPKFLSISYEKPSGLLPSMVATKLRYLVRRGKRRMTDGRTVEVEEHVVLLSKEDLPKAAPVKPRDVEILSMGLLTPKD